MPEFSPALGGFGRPMGRSRGFGVNSLFVCFPYDRGAFSSAEGGGGGFCCREERLLVKDWHCTRVQVRVIIVEVVRIRLDRIILLMLKYLFPRDNLNSSRILRFKLAFPRISYFSFPPAAAVIGLLESDLFDYQRLNNEDVTTKRKHHIVNPFEGEKSIEMRLLHCPSRVLSQHLRYTRNSKRQYNFVISKSPTRLFRTSARSQIVKPFLLADIGEGELETAVIIGLF